MVVPITFARNCGTAPRGQRLRLAAMQTLVVDSRKHTDLQTRVGNEIGIIKGLRRDHQVDAAFFCEASHEDTPEIVHLFREGAVESGVFIGFGQQLAEGESVYQMVGPDDFCWVERKRSGLVSALEVLQPSFVLKGARIKVEICGDIGAGRELLESGVKVAAPPIDLMLNPSAAPPFMLAREFPWAAGGYKPRAYLGINSTLFFDGRYDGGKSTFATFDSLGRVTEMESLADREGILIADLALS